MTVFSRACEPTRKHQSIGEHTQAVRTPVKDGGEKRKKVLSVLLDVGG